MAERYWLQMQHGHGPKAKVFGMVFETDHPGLDELTDELVLRGAVCGSRLELVSDSVGDGKVILGRQPFTLGLAGLVCIQPYFKTVRELEA